MRGLGEWFDIMLVYICVCFVLDVLSGFMVGVGIKLILFGKIVKEDMGVL